METDAKRQHADNSCGRPLNAMVSVSKDKRVARMTATDEPTIWTLSAAETGTFLFNGFHVHGVSLLRLSYWLLRVVPLVSMILWWERRKESLEHRFHADMHVGLILRMAVAIDYLRPAQ